MSSQRFTITPPNNGSNWFDVDVTGSALDGVIGDVPVTINPVDKTMNVNYVGQLIGFVSGLNTISVAHRTGNTTPFDVLISIP